MKKSASTAYISIRRGYMILHLSRIFILFVLFCSFRESSAPFITGDGFRAHCDFHFDETGNTIDLQTIQDGATIFVKTDMLEEFCQTIVPRLMTKYVLVTHNSDHP